MENSEMACVPKAFHSANDGVGHQVFSLEQALLSEYLLHCFKWLRGGVFLKAFMTPATVYNTSLHGIGSNIFEPCKICINLTIQIHFSSLRLSYNFHPLLKVNSSLTQRVETLCGLYFSLKWANVISQKGSFFPAYSVSEQFSNHALSVTGRWIRFLMIMIPEDLFIFSPKQWTLLAKKKKKCTLRHQQLSEQTWGRFFVAHLTPSQSRITLISVRLLPQ